jgi:hypothetical protein
MKITVHNFRVWNNVLGDYVFPERKSSAERIKRIGGEIIANTAEDVDPSALDEHDRYDPRLAMTSDA